MCTKIEMWSNTKKDVAKSNQLKIARELSLTLNWKSEGWGCSPAGRVLPYFVWSPSVPSPTVHKPGMVVFTGNSNTQEVETRELEKF